MTKHRKRIPFALLTAALAMTSCPSFAQEYTYAPDYCEFSATFPEEPHINKACEPDDPTACYDLVSFTKVFDMVSTVQVDIICNPSTEEVYNSLDEEKMKATVINMTKDTVLQTHEVGARDAGAYRHAGLVGLSRLGMDDSLFIAQLWSGKKSIMSVKAQLIGQQMDATDELMAKILRGIGHIETMKSAAESPKEEKAQAPETTPQPKP